MSDHLTSTQTPAEEPRRRGGCLWVVLGSFLVLIGIPMLVLPGPGLVSIGAGVALIMRGLGIRRPGGDA